MHLPRALLMIVPLLSISGALANPPGPINVLVMHWYDRGNLLNDEFDSTLYAALQSSAPEGVEYYSEYLETNKFPGEDQARLLSEYLRQKYAGRRLDVIISGVSETLDFLLKYRHELFSNVPLVFASERPLPPAVLSEAGATGFTFGNAYAKTLDLALKWHPGTKQLFVVSGTLNHDKAVESIVRDDLRPYEGALTITYLTDLAPDELAARIRTLPNHSVILYVWQQVLDPQGRLLETRDVLEGVTHEAKVPIYGRSHAMIGRGIIGGYVWTQEGNAAKLADITMRVVHGIRPKDIPVEKGPETPMFDWRQLQRWSIGEDRLPPGSVIRFRELTVWQQYKWRIVGAIVLFALQAFLIGALLVERRRARRSADALANSRRVLQESEERFRLAIAATNDAIWDVDLKTGTVIWNETYSTLYGRPPETSDSWQWWIDRIHPEDRERTADGLRRAISSGASSWTCEYRFQQADGRWAYIYDRAYIARDAAGAAWRVIGAMQDLTERKRAEQALRENEHRLVSIYNTVRDAIFHLAVEPDGQFRFVSVNAAFLSVTGLSLERVVDKTVNEVIPEPSLTMVLGKYRQAVEENTIVVWEETSDYPTRRLTGEVSVAPVFDNNGNCTHLVGSVYDVTERNRAEETLRRNVDEIAHLNRVASMGELTASIAHEINQPLAAILSNAQAASRLLGGEPPDLAQVRECLTDIVADDKRAGEVIGRIRGLLKQRASQPSRVDLNEVVSDAIRLLGTDAMLRNVSVKVEPFPGLPAVLGDRIQLYQLALNLIMNGLDAVAERSPGDRWVLVRTAEADGGGVELTVEDSGNGVAASDLARVFEPFFSTKREGLGIGLSISRSIVQKHGGKIWAENSARHGAIFHCVLPVAQQAAVAATK